MSTTARERLRAVREVAGVSARELSALAGLSPGMVALLEAGTRRFGYRSASALARVLGVGVAWLMDGGGKPPSARAVLRAVRRASGERVAA